MFSYAKIDLWRYCAECNVGKFCLQNMETGLNIKIQKTLGPDLHVGLCFTISLVQNLNTFNFHSIISIAKSRCIEHYLFLFWKIPYHSYSFREVFFCANRMFSITMILSKNLNLLWLFLQGLYFIKLLLLIFCSVFLHKPQIWLATHLAEYRKIGWSQ